MRDDTNYLCIIIGTSMWYLNSVNKKGKTTCNSLNLIVLMLPNQIINTISY